MDAEISSVYSASAVLGIVEFEVRASKIVGKQVVVRTMTVRRPLKVTSTFGPCAQVIVTATDEFPATMIHVNPIDIYRVVERGLRNVNRPDRSRSGGPS